jgi:YesN/AraC family two-component response regulator
VYYCGVGISEVGGIEHHYMPNSFVIIPPMLAHSELAIEKGDLFVAGFDLDLSGEQLANRLYSDTENLSVMRILDIVVTEQREEKALFIQRMSNLMQDVILVAMRQCQGKKPRGDYMLKAIMSYIDSYYTTDIDFRNLANSMYYSYDYMRHYFKSCMKMTLNQYVVEKRIILAKQLLAKNMPVSKVAKQIGFSSPAYFTVLFKNHTGMLPKEYIKQCIEQAHAGIPTHIDP